MLDELQASIIGALSSCNAFVQAVYFLDWQHESFQVDGPATEKTWVNGFPDGDYAIFLGNDMSLGTFGHPWEYSICFFGENFVNEVLKNRPRILDSVLRNKGCFPI